MSQIVHYPILSVMFSPTGPSRRYNITGLAKRECPSLQLNNHIMEFKNYETEKKGYNEFSIYFLLSEVIPNNKYRKPKEMKNGQSLFLSTNWKRQLLKQSFKKQWVWLNEEKLGSLKIENVDLNRINFQVIFSARVQPVGRQVGLPGSRQPAARQPQAATGQPRQLVLLLDISAAAVCYL